MMLVVLHYNLTAVVDRVEEEETAQNVDPDFGWLYWGLIPL